MGSAGDDRLTGREGNDYIEGAAGDDRLEGGSGDDVFYFKRGHGNDHIVDFGSGDVIVFEGLGVTKAQVLGAATLSRSGGTWIDLTPFGGGTLILSGYPRNNFDESDFLL